MTTLHYAPQTTGVAIGATFSYLLTKVVFAA